MTNLSISETDREQFINFMMQKDYIPTNNQVRYDAVIYILKTDWLKPFHTTFYVGYATDMNHRINGDGYQKGHKDSYQEKWRDVTPGDLQTVKSDWTVLQNAAKANTTKTPAPAYTQNDIDTATMNAENTASNTWTSAKTSAGTYDNEASDLKKKADAIPGSMGCH